MGSTLSQLNTQNDLLTNVFTPNSTQTQPHSNSSTSSFNRDILLLSKDADLLSRKASLLTNLTGDFSLQGFNSNMFYYNVYTTPVNNQNLTNTFTKNPNLSIKFGYFNK